MVLRGFLIVSSTDRMRQAASDAAVRALIRTMDGSQTQALKLSAMSSLLMSTPYHMPPWRQNTGLISRFGQSLECPRACFQSYLCVFGSQFVEDVGGVEAGVVAQLPGDDFQGLGVGADEQLLFSWDGPGVVAQVLGQLHLYRASTRHNRVVLRF